MTSDAASVDELADIVTWGERIETYVQNMNVDDFTNDPRTQDAVIRCLEVIGEAASKILKLESDFEVLYPDVALSAAYRTRNRTAHGYGSIDLQAIWRSATVASPEIVDGVRRLVQQHRRSERRQ